MSYDDQAFEAALEAPFEAAFETVSYASSCEASEEQYTHLPLGTGPWICILGLEPGSASDPVRCLLRPVDRGDAKGEYAAVSYAWGTEQATQRIVVDDKTFYIRRNLHTFLGSVRSPYRRLYLWVDAICIDQASIAEKGHQVAQMRYVFEDASKTYLWLGVPTPAMAKVLLSPPSGLSSRSGTRPPFPSDLEEVLPQILGNPYWTRLWIIQEITVSRNVQVRFGLIEVSWKELVRICKVITLELSADDTTLRKRTKTLDSSQMIRLSELRYGAAQRSFVDLIKDFGNCLCMDVRDRVYGLLGLVSDLKLEVDYNLVEVEVFERVMNSCESQLMIDLFLPLAAALCVNEWQKLSLRWANFSVQVEIRHCGELRYRNGSWYWVRDVEDNAGLPLMLNTYQNDRHFMHGDALYTLSSNSRSPEDIKSSNTNLMLIIQTRYNRDLIPGPHTDGDKFHSNYVAGTAILYNPADMGIQAHKRMDENAMVRVAEHNVHKTVFQWAIIHLKRADEDSMTLEAGVRDLIYFCENFDLC